MSLKKRYLTSKPICKVTFEVPKKIAEGAHSIHLVGEFNGWDESGTPMIRRKAGNFNITVDLETGRGYEYRYLIDGASWRNDSQADGYVSSHIPGVENSLVVV